MGQGKERKGQEGLLREVHPVHVLPPWGDAPSSSLLHCIAPRGRHLHWSPGDSRLEMRMA